MTGAPAPLEPDLLLQVADGLDLLLISDDELLIQFGIRSRPSELLRDRDLTGVIGRIVTRLLDGPVTVADLLSPLPAEHQADAGTLIADLLQAGVLSETGRSPVDQYLRYTFTGEPTFRDRSVTLVGAGPLGARIAHSLQQHGLGSLTLLDHRPVDRLWHSLAPLGHTIASPNGLPAQDAVRNWLSSKADSAVECLDAQMDAAGMEAAVARSDLTVVAFEQPELRLAHLVNRFSIRDRKPWLL